jgi:hypothetical protein
MTLKGSILKKHKQKGQGALADKITKNSLCPQSLAFFVVQNANFVGL